MTPANTTGSSGLVAYKLERMSCAAGGVFAGIVLAMLVSRVRRSFLFGVQPSDPATLLIVGALFSAVGCSPAGDPFDAQPWSIHCKH